MSTDSLQREESGSSSTKRRARIVSKSEVLLLCRPGGAGGKRQSSNSCCSVRVAVEKGSIAIQSLHGKTSLFKACQYTVLLCLL